MPGADDERRRPAIREDAPDALGWLIEILIRPADGQLCGAAAGAIMLAAMAIGLPIGMAAGTFLGMRLTRSRMPPAESP